MPDDRLRDVARRRWYVFLLGLAATLATVVMIGQASGQHHVRAELAFFVAGGRPGFAEDVPPGGSLIPFVGAVEIRANDGWDLTFPSTEAQLQATGTSSGTWIRAVDLGGQWVRQFNEPTIVVESVDPTPEGAEELFKEALGRVEAATVEMQVAHTPADQEIAFSVTDISRTHVGPGRTSIIKASAVTLGVGSLLTVLVARIVDTAFQPRPRVGRHTSPED